MSNRTLGIGALVATGAVVALIAARVAAREPSTDTPVPRARTANPTGVEPASAARGARWRPSVLPPETSPVMDTTGVGDQPLWNAYDDEQRDPVWANETEHAVRSRLRTLLDAANHGTPGSVSVPQVECREVHCRMLVTGSDESSFTRFVESLQDERGFYGDAAQLALDGYREIATAGVMRREVRVHLKYDR